jgi:hypothetical protein
MAYSFISFINKDFVLTVESLFNYKLIFTKHSVVDKINFYLFSNKKKDKISSLKNYKICGNMINMKFWVIQTGFYWISKFCRYQWIQSQ